MIKCQFENADKPDAKLRHVVVDCVAINDQHQILLVRRAVHLSNPNKLAVPGGFLNRDETTKEAVLRELMEETGYTGEIQQLLQINDDPNRRGEDRQNVGFVYIIQVGDRIREHDDEVSAVTWFDLDNLPDEDEFAFDHFNIISIYKNYLKGKYALPVFGNTI